jgi:hypothetical protein
MNRSVDLLFIAFLAIAPVLHAQTAINLEAVSSFSGSTLPLRNLLIEVRQVSMNDASSTSASVQGAVQLKSGASSMQGQVQSSTRQSSQSANSQQQVLVLNGRAASIALRNSVPLRLVQAVVHNGVMIIVPGVVMLEAGTGFSALPRWDGQGPVELAISAVQGQGRYQTQNAGTATLVMVSLGEWVTVAQSDQQSISTAGTWSGSVDDRQTTGTLVQVRVTAP